MSNNHALTSLQLVNGATILDNSAGQFMPQNYGRSGSLYNLENI
jgi:hypothetical protein